MFIQEKWQTFYKEFEGYRISKRDKLLVLVKYVDICVQYILANYRLKSYTGTTLKNSRFMRRT